MLLTELLLLITSLLSPLPAAQQQSAIPRAVTGNPHGNLNMACETCHTATAWKPIRSIPEFDHNKTRFPLRGMHENVACMQCHTKPVFKNVGSRCADCHADLHRGQFGAGCERCHSVRGWNVSIQSIQNHQNRFPLVGAHAALDCESCHKGAATGQFAGLTDTCYSCHAKDYQTTTGPNHAQAGFPTTCEDCHTMNSWFGAKFDHLKFTGFALTGAHAQLPCTACHVGGRFKGTPANCFGCHQKDFVTANNPNHVAAMFPTSCQTCHNTTAWQPATFDHNTFTKFPLTGAHVNVPCAQCHLNGNFSNAPTACSGCHMKDYNGTTNPNHAAAGFPTDCSVCHSTTTWLNATFNHAATGFPLTGAHATLQCSACHLNGVFTNLSPACSSCHMKDYQGTTNPNHAAAGFPTDCSICHTTTSWAGATFNHNNTPFPLTGAHVTVPCLSCHVNNVFAGTPTDCYSCHKTDYQSTTNPNHVAAGFPTTCATCHTTTSWLGATFNHTWFPIPHHTATTCGDCHTNPSNFAVFLCTNCHTQATTNQQHQGVSGYVWNSANCYACHPTGQSGG
jgi:hypothetical protein